MTLRKTCPGCGAEMAILGPEAAIKGPQDAEVPTTTGPVWQCRECWLECEIGADVLAQIQGNPWLL